MITPSVPKIAFAGPDQKEQKWPLTTMTHTRTRLGRGLGWGAPEEAIL